MRLAVAVIKKQSTPFIEPPTILHLDCLTKIPFSAASARRKIFSRRRIPICFFRMESKDNGFFQTAVQGVPPYITARTERFGLVIGSGGKGQTFLFWKSDLLFQLPVSYWNEVGWVNSPGYRDGVAYFDRPVNSRCLECHGTYFESLAPPAESL